MSIARRACWRSSPSWAIFIRASSSARERPRVGLLSIGEEEHKGNELTRAATPLLKALPIHFIGNVEGRDIYTGDTDVIVCDGFIGNVALKVSEGLVDMIYKMLRESLEATITRKIGYVLSRTAFQDFKKRVDYSEYGGAPLLGVKGVCIICHGRSNANAIKNAIRVAAEFAERTDQRADRSGVGNGQFAHAHRLQRRTDYDSAISGWLLRAGWQSRGERAEDPVQWTLTFDAQVRRAWLARAGHGSTANDRAGLASLFADHAARRPESRPPRVSLTIRR